MLQHICDICKEPLGRRYNVVKVVDNGIESIEEELCDLCVKRHTNRCVVLDPRNAKPIERKVGA